MDDQSDRIRRVSHWTNCLLAKLHFSPRRRRLRCHEQPVLPLLDERHKPCNRPVDRPSQHLDENNRNSQHRHGHLSRQDHLLHPVTTNNHRRNLLHWQRNFTLHDQHCHYLVQLRQLYRTSRRHHHRSIRIHKHGEPRRNHQPHGRTHHQLQSDQHPHRNRLVHMQPLQLHTWKLYCDNNRHERDTQPLNPDSSPRPRNIPSRLCTHSGQSISHTHRTVDTIDHNRHSEQRILRNSPAHRQCPHRPRMHQHNPEQHNRLRSRILLLQLEPFRQLHCPDHGNIRISVSQCQHNIPCCRLQPRDDKHDHISNRQ